MDLRTETFINPYVIRFDQPPFDEYVDTIFKSAALDRTARQIITRDLKEAAQSLSVTLENCEKLVLAAKIKKYSIITRFTPPYSTTVTLYNPTTGFITLSRLDVDFDENTKVLVSGYDHMEITKGALAAIDGIFEELSSQPKMRHGMRGIDHNILSQQKRNHLKDVFIRNELHPLTQTHTYRLENLKIGARTDSFELFSLFRDAWWKFLYRIAIMINIVIGGSRLSFDQGPAAVMNDFLYGTHGGQYARNVHVIDGELSAHLNPLGLALAWCTISYVNIIITAVVASATAFFYNEDAWQLVAFIVGLSLAVYQASWNFFVANTTVKIITANDFRVRYSRQATILFRMSEIELKVFLTMASPWHKIKAHGNNNSYVDIRDTGVLSIEHEMPIDILYLAGYLTTSMAEPDRIPLAVLVPYDTHRLVYGSNGKVRQLSTIDGKYHLSKSHRSQLQYDTEAEDARMVIKHDSDWLLPPSELTVITEGEIG